jgi:hypothetical protein
MEERHEVIVRCERWVIVNGWVGGGEAFVDLKEINAKCGGGFGGIESFQLSASSFNSCMEVDSDGRHPAMKTGYDVIGQWKAGNSLRMGWWW